VYNQKPLSGDLIDYGHPLSQGLVGLWLMNEGSGNKVFDLSGNGNIGTFVNSPIWKVGKHGYAIDFVSASDQYIDLGVDVSILKPQTISVSAIFKADLLTGIRGIVDGTDSDGDDGYILASSGTALNFYIDDGGFKIATGTIAAGIWYHAIGTFDGVTVKLYINGVLQATTAGATKVDYGISRHFIGRYLNASYDWDGLIDSVSIYNRVLSASEAALLQEPFCMVRTRRRRIITEEIAGVPPTTFPYYYREIASRRIA